MDGAIQSFNAVTGNKEGGVANFYLESAQNDVEAAINMFMESGGAVPDAAGQDEGGEEASEEQHEGRVSKLSVVDRDEEEQRCDDRVPQIARTHRPNRCSLVTL
jgi:hypothetical protein